MLNKNLPRFGTIQTYTYMPRLQGATVTIKPDDDSEIVSFTCNGTFCLATAGVNDVHLDVEFSVLMRRPQIGERIVFITESADRFQARLDARAKLFPEKEMRLIHFVLGGKIEIIAFGPEKSWKKAEREMSKRPIFGVFEPGGTKDPIFEGTIQQIAQQGKDLWRLHLDVKVKDGKRWQPCIKDPRQLWLLGKESVLPSKKKLVH